MTRGIVTKERISISKVEYKRLKKLDAQFGQFLAYAKKLLDIRDARRETERKEIISQDKLFRRLGL